MGINDFSRRLIAQLKWSLSLEDSSLQNIIWHYIAIIKTMGITMNENMTSNKIYIPAMIIGFTLTLLEQFGYVHAIITWNDHRRVDTEFMYVSIYSVSMKLGWLFWKRQEIMDLLNMAQKQNASLTQREEESVTVEMKIMKWRCRTFCLTQATFVFIYLYSGIIIGSSLTPTFPVIYPGIEDETSLRNIAIYHVIRPIFIVHILLIMTSFWVMFVAIVGHACAHAKAVATEVSSLKSSDEELSFSIRYAVKRHQKLQAFVVGINHLISAPIGIELGIQFIGVCVTFQEPCEVTVLCISYTMFLYLLYCYFGQYLINSGEGIERALLDADWHRMKPRDARILLVMLINCQRPLKLTTFSIFDLTSPMYMAFLKMLYSAFTFVAAVF